MIPARKRDYLGVNPDPAGPAPVPHRLMRLSW